MIYLVECPCKNCSERTMNCHSKCPKYLSWKDSGIEQEKPWATPRRKKFMQKNIRK